MQKVRLFREAVFAVQGGSKTFELKTFEICQKMSKTFEIFEIYDFGQGAKTFEGFP